ncbi:hypothetical protein [Streptomyces telluris]|uniref:Uncharacterized protein n=1 Tax=Streptomyces telluris TaxID=2720021 RepID=A0A9X2RQ96_9ACTN|nr:hypothetical protein [Streptomyces telluris]MCQ8772065.1 hypothetical protein [Streptomyces telluris]NJP76646.1 hypothetical protein [Streptomyces telluris]
MLRDLMEPVRASFCYDDGSPEILLARIQHWNRLQIVAQRWEDADGYDRARWTPVFHLDAAGEERAAEYRRQEEEKRDAYERRKLLRGL